MPKLKKISKFKIFIALLILAAIGYGVYFGVCNIIWFNYKKVCVSFLDSPRLQGLMATPTVMVEVEGGGSYEHILYRYEEYDEGFRSHCFQDDSDGQIGYTIVVNPPRYLKFDGGVQVITPSIMDYVVCGVCENCETAQNCNNGKMIYLSECQIDLRINLKDWRYSLGIADLTVLDSAYETMHSYFSLVDKNAQPLGKHPGDTEVQYQEWLALYEKFEDEIMELFETINSSEYFGDILR